MIKRRPSRFKRSTSGMAMTRVTAPAQPVVVSARGLSRAVGPTEEMLHPVAALAEFMATLPATACPAVFASRGVTIIENFAPYVFVGNRAVARWERGFRLHVSRGKLTSLKVAFGRPHDFGAGGRRAFFVLPTIWTGRAAGVRFEERGAWSVVLIRAGGAWRILGYGWGVTSLRVRPARRA